jgi:hypothetical protein
VYLVVFQHVPVERRRDLIGDVAGAVVSAGSICSCLGAATGLVADVNKTLMCEWSLSRWLARLLCRFGAGAAMRGDLDRGSAGWAGRGCRRAGRYGGTITFRTSGGYGESWWVFTHDGRGAWR